eukprot:CAMPEP_0177615796 /NCGR_PEP_ID=MMETSP0419_2-20121207/23719_1 /TAXON_ID=582737 /ORGANISM="Tetraselmis sp., Strain GSL018" /LENGTH=141 /DNA_ID=CAMNT_0019113623 /DNA_START=533 /DNA_END=955 /DNA_ORIENTATION=+
MFRTLMSPSVRNAMDEREMGVIEIISSDDEEYAQPSPSGRTGPCSAQAGIRRRRDPPRRTRRQFNPILNDDQSPEVQPCEIVDLTSDTAATAEGAGDCVIVGSVPPPPKHPEHDLHHLRARLLPGVHQAGRQGAEEVPDLP